MKKILGLFTAIACVAAMSVTANADITSYTQDFEGLDAASGSALGDDGWLVGANVFNSGGGFLYNYFSFPAPNGGSGFSGIATGEGGAAQGAQQLNTYNDYNNQDHFNGSGNVLEAILFREWTVGAADVGKTYTFDYDAKLGNLAAPTTSNAFIKTIDPGAGFATTNFVVDDTTGTSPSTWESNSLALTIDAGLVGQIFQIGFSSTATAGNDSGVFYDNVSLTSPASVPEPSSIALLGLGALGMVVRRRRG